MLSVAGINKYVVKQYYVKTAFINGKLKDEIYMKLPEQEKGTENRVFRLKKVFMV
jgi:hypothetical protein